MANGNYFKTEKSDILIWGPYFYKYLDDSHNRNLLSFRIKTYKKSTCKIFTVND